VSYDWDFGDETTATGSVVNHSYALPGTFTVVLIVTDDGGLTAVDAVVVEVVYRSGASRRVSGAEDCLAQCDGRHNEKQPS
jgi:chitinase